MHHPHFDYIEEAATELYRSKATGQYVILSQRGEEVVAIPAMHDGTRLPVHAEPLAWGADEYEALDGVHALR